MKNQNEDWELETAFKEAYASLNAAQKEAVDSIEGPVMVIAGPGTGKTQILTLRIANILLQTDTAPESILALTFTESGTKAMRERLRKYIGSRAYQVPIFTFHGFSQKLIHEYPDAYNRVIGGKPASDIEKINIIEAILESNDIKLLRPMGNPSYYVQKILHILQDLKREYITPNDFAIMINEQEKELQNIKKIHDKGAHKGKIRGEYTKKEKSIAKNRELLHIYIQYEALLSQKSIYDFEDMIVETVKALSNNEEMLRNLQETYQYVLADEHQDVNGSQNKILELLSSYHDSPNIFVVGDEKQAIFRFQGASLENFLYFENVFPATKIIALTQNYRSGQNILDVAHKLVAVEDGPLKELRVHLKAEIVKKSDVFQHIFSHQAIEDDWLVAEVKKEIFKGIPLKEIAIIVRTNKEVEALSANFRKEGLPVSASADTDILQHPITQAIRSLLNAVISDKDESSLFTLLHGAYWEISLNDLIKICNARNYTTSITSIMLDKAKLKELKIDEIEKVLRVLNVLQETKKREVHEAPHRVLEFLLKESGFLNHIIKYDPFEGTRVVRRLYDEIEELVVQDGVGTLNEICTMFSTRLSYGLPLNAPYIKTNIDSLQVMTAHKSKGLEFATVFAPHLYDSNWGGSTKRTYFDIPYTKHLKENPLDALDDERRLFYVIMTRAKERLFLSYSDINANGKELIPTRLLNDLQETNLITQNTSKTENKFDPLKKLNPTPPNIIIDKCLLTNLLSERGFSATSLNNYLHSPWNYFYRNVLRIPEVQPTHMMFGTSMHRVLEKITKFHTQKGKLPTTTEIKKLLELELNKLSITTEEYIRLHEKGLTALLTYIPFLLKTLPKTTKEEMKVRVILKTGLSELPELPLTGTLDRIDFNEKGLAKRVVDYKTGKFRTRNAIEGKTKNDGGSYKRQLVFYTLLLNLYNDQKFLCNYFTLSFIEPDSKGFIHEETFTISDEEVEELKKEIITATKEIISGDLFNIPCDPSKSNYCDLVKLLSDLS